MEEKSGEPMANAQGKGEQEKKQGAKSKKPILLLILAIVVLLGGFGSFYFFSVSSQYFTTDNAKVTAKMYTITPSLSGKLLEWSAKEGERVEKNKILGRQEVLPYITSPIDGTVVKSNGVEGQMVSPTTQLAVVADTDNLYIGVNIEETDILKVKVGQPVDVKIDAYAGKTFPGVITEIDRTTQTYFSSASSFSTSGTYTKVTQLIPVKVVIENKDNLPLTFGMNATVKIHIKENVSNQTAVTSETAVTSGTQQVSSYTSSVEASDLIAVTPNVSGKVSTINVAIGQSVKAGDVLFTLDSADYDLAVKQAKASIVPVQTAYNEAAANYGRMQKLFAAGAVSRVDRDGAKAKTDTAAGQLDAAKAALEIAQKKLDDCSIKAPMAGEVSAKNIAVGNMISPQTASITLINAQNLIVRINVTETNIAKVKIGMNAEVNVQAINAKIIGAVSSVAPASDAKTGTFPVEILVNNADGKIKPGMMADVSLQE